MRMRRRDRMDIEDLGGENAVQNDLCATACCRFFPGNLLCSSNGISVANTCSSGNDVTKNRVNDIGMALRPEGPCRCPLKEPVSLSSQQLQAHRAVAE